MRIFLTSLASSLSVTGSLAAALAARAISDLICGQNGWDTGHESYFSETDGYINTISGCSAKCNADTTYLSFAIGPNDCELYDVPAKGNFAADSSSPFAFYDKGCAQLSQQCGVAGYRHSHYYSKGSESKTDGQNDCNDLPSCASWAYRIGEYFNFDENIGNNVDVDPSSPYIYYDKVCDFSSSTTTTATAKTTKASAKTTATSKPSPTTTAKATTTTTTSTKKSSTKTTPVVKSTTALTISKKVTASTTKLTSCTTTKATTTYVSEDNKDNKRHYDPLNGK